MNRTETKVLQQRCVYLLHKQISKVNTDTLLYIRLYRSGIQLESAVKKDDTIFSRFESNSHLSWYILRKMPCIGLLIFTTQNDW